MSRDRSVIDPMPELGVVRHQELDALFQNVLDANEQRDGDLIEHHLTRFTAILHADDAIHPYYKALLPRLTGSMHYIREEYDQGIEQFERSVAMCREIGDLDGEARAIMGMGNCCIHGGRIEESVKYHSQAVEMLTDVGNNTSLVQGYMNLGISYLAVGEFERSIAIYHKALDLAQQIGDESKLGQICMNLAGPYFYTGDYASSMKYSLKAYDQCLKGGLTEVAMMAAGNVSYLAFSVGSMELSEQWGKIVWEYRRSAKDNADRTNALLNQLMVRVKIDDDSASINALEEAILTHLKGEHKLHATQSIAFLVESLIRHEYFERAEEIAEVGWQAVQELGFRPGLLELKRLRLELSMRHGVTEDQIVLCESIIEEARETEERDDLEKTLDVATRLYKARGEFEKSLEYCEEYIRVRAKNAEVRSRHITEMAGVQFEHDRLNQLSDKQQELLSSVMPDEIVERLMHGEENIADAFDEVSVMFLDLVSFTDLSSSVPPAHLIHLLNAVFSTCDDVVGEHGLTKIKTIGDSYLAVSGLPHSQDDHALRMANAAIDLTSRLKDLQVTMPPELGDTSWVNDAGDLSIRIGLHCGPVVAGVIGRHRAQYDVWGDTVNTASRMESNGQPDRIHISEDFAMKIAQGASPEFEGTDVVIRRAPYLMRLRGTTTIKGKGEMKTFWLEGA